jgi:outer membrane protein OmpA-like peptidoglycan-associated protein
MRRWVFAVPVLVLAVGSGACASKKYVNSRVGDVNDKVTSMGSSLEETQERTKRNEARIGDVDQKAGAAAARADEASRSAADARAAADDAAARADALDRASRRLVYEVVLAEDKAKFRSGHALLTADAKTELDGLVETLEQDPRPVFIEIEGHTDSVGSPAYNERLGLERAEAVKRYLYEQHHIPLHKMNVISFGETKPVAPNTTRDGRAQNRRVVVKVLA